ncbi:MAG TPA: EF-hand domain-containing protein [Candidatus Didemnitutus sp.]|nr:EF-hand domain-containing protein [Candidatus Didemnitutus sp.]
MLAFASVAMTAAVSLSGQITAEQNREYNARQWASLTDNPAQMYSDRLDREAAMNPVSFDLNHDGKLDAQEYAAWLAMLRSCVSKQPSLMKKFDTNHDGRLDDAEWVAACAKIFEPKAPAPAATK